MSSVKSSKLIDSVAVALHIVKIKMQEVFLQINNRNREHLSDLKLAEGLNKVV